MNFICLSDLHLTCDTPINRLDNIEEVWKQKLKFVFDECIPTDIVLQAGDFFDKPRDWYTLWEVTKFISCYSNQILTIFGQHDTYLYSEKTRRLTSLGILSVLNNVTVLDNYREMNKQIVVHGCSYGQKIPAPINNKINILLIHKDISNRDLGFKYTDAKKFLRLHEFDLIVCGDIHIKFCEEFRGRFIINSGPLLRLEASKEMFNHYPGFWKWDSEIKIPKWVEIPHESAGIVLNRDSINAKTELNKISEEFFNSIQDTEELQSFKFSDNLKQFIIDNKIEKEVTDILSDEISEGDYYG